jgi:hypothetical protein
VVFVLLSFAVPFVVGLVLRKGHRWLLALGVIIFLARWLSSLCPKDLEVACGWQSAFVTFVWSLYILAPWVAGVGAAYSVRQRLRGRV